MISPTGNTVLFMVLWHFALPFTTTSSCVASTATTETFHNCDVVLVSPNRYSFTCHVYFLTSVKVSVLPNSTMGILVTCNMEAVAPNFTCGEPVCLLLTGGRVKKLSYSEYQAIGDNSNRYELSEATFLPLMSVQQFEAHIIFRTQKNIGMAHYNATCLQQVTFNASSESSDVSHCFQTIQILRSVDMPGDSISLPRNYSLVDLFNKSFFTILLQFMDYLWLTEYNGTIVSLNLTMENDFSYLPQDALELLSKKSVERLSFPNNAFVEIKEGDLPVMPSLKKLSFNGCDIETIHPMAFKGLFNLVSIDLGGNRLKMAPQAIAILPHLEALSLNGNRLPGTFLYAGGVFGHLRHLRSMDLSNMWLDGTWNNIEVLPELLELKFQNCSIIMPHNFLFERFPLLIDLDLSHNNMANMSEKVFVGLTNLQSLDLSGAFLQNTPYNDIIQILPNLKTLILSNNSITDFLPLNLSKHHHFKTLDLRFNNIDKWAESRIQLAENNSLSIDLQNNNITEVTDGMIQDFSFLREIKLGSNTYDCSSCSLPGFKQWLLANQSSNIIDYSPSAFTCSFPREYLGQSLMGIVFDEKHCREVIFNWILNVVLPVLIVFILMGILVTMAVMHRWYILYFFHIFRVHLRRYRQREEQVGHFRFDAFVSYCTSDSDWVVHELVPTIETQASPLHLCVHERDFEIGEYILNNIIECIDNSRKSIFVLSSSFIRSQWCQWELQMAQHKLFEDSRDVLILVMLGEIDSSIDIPKLLKRLMKTRTYLLWPSNATNVDSRRKLFWSRLRDAIGPCQCMKLQDTSV